MAARSRMALRFIQQCAIVVALVVASCAVSLLILEAGVRIVDGVPLTLTENFVARDLDAVHKQGAPAIHDARLGWVPVPNSSWDFDRTPVPIGDYTFGEYGARMSRPQIVPLQQGAILVVGDSFGAGAEVRDQDSWPAQLERMVGGQVINATVGGYGLDQIVLRAEELLPRLKPRMLLVQTRLEFGISVNRMRIYGGAPKPYFVVRDGHLVLENQPVPRLAATSRDIGSVRSILGYSYLIKYVMTRLDLLQWWVSSGMATQFALSNDEAVEVTCLLMRRLAELRERYNIPVTLVFQYSGMDGTQRTISWDLDRGRAIGCTQQKNLDVIDVLEQLRSAYRAEGAASYQRLWVMHDNGRVYGHMSAEGNQLIARLVYAHLWSTPSMSRSSE